MARRKGKKVRRAGKRRNSSTTRTGCDNEQAAVPPTTPSGEKRDGLMFVNDESSASESSNMHPAFPFTENVDAFFLSQLPGNPALKGTRQVDRGRTICAEGIRTHATRNQLPPELTLFGNRNMPEALPSETIVGVGCAKCNEVLLAFECDDFDGQCASALTRQGWRIVREYLVCCA